MDAPDMYRGHSIGRAALNKAQGIEGPHDSKMIGLPVCGFGEGRRKLIAFFCDAHHIFIVTNLLTSHTLRRAEDYFGLTPERIEK